MNYTNRSGDQRQPDMPAVAPLDLSVGAEQQRQPRRRIAPKSPRQVLQPETAPPPPPRSQKARHPLVVVLNFFVMVVVLIALAGGAAFYFGSKRFSEPGSLAQSTSVLIQPGSDLDSISAQLERHNVIDNPFIFSTAVRFFYKAEDKLRAGEYLFEANASMEQVLEDLLSGRSVLHALTFPEGWTSQAIVDRLNADPVLTGDVKSVPPEGSLMPETYKFTRGATREQMIEQMQRAQKRAVEDIWGRRAPGLPIETQEEFVTLASIVEKETGKADERPRVASVFINRLAKGMRLQSDPTVLYGLFGGKGRPADRPIYQSDLEKQTPYNTYQVAGLPPTPIANPGRAALEAVANPSRTADLYFVADGTGGHVFAPNLEEHNRNVARWRQIRAAQEQAQEAAPATATPATSAPAAGEAGAAPAAAAEGAAADEAPAEGGEGQE
jgi:UPF0755 protein